MEKIKRMNSIKMVRKGLLLLFALMAANLVGQDVNKYTISGHIKDFSTGEELINASLFVKELNEGTVSNLYGYYSITLEEGDYTVVYSYLGYESTVKQFSLNKDLRLDVEMKEADQVLNEITITAEEKDENIQSTQMSRVSIDVEAVKKMPALLGEVDIIKAIQLLPGVKSLGEGTSGFYVRGGNVDQNLVLLDEAPIYNASHMLGFFSSFNPDAIKDMQLYKGAISSRYGGRLSSVLDIRMKEGNSKKFGGSGGIGTIMSRLSLEAPLGENGSFILSGRRSYLDILAKLALPKEDNNSQFYFFDLNAKGNYRLNDNDRLFVSGYFGRDVINADEEGVAVEWGNKTATARWNHIFSPKVFSNLTFYFSDYDYFLDSEEDISEFRWDARLKEYSLKADVSFFLSPSYTLKTGLQAIQHNLEPGKIKVSENKEVITDFTIQSNKSIENAVYVSNELTINKDLKVDFGIRGSSLHNVGPQTHFNQNENFEQTDSTNYDSGIYHSYYNLEPRLGVKYNLGTNQSLKASYNRTTQYIQLASNGNASTPFDIWFTASPKVKPQLADQYALGYFRNFAKNAFEFSAEVYYKDFINAIDFKERAQLLLNKNLEGDLRVGKGRAYGLELMLKKETGKWTGWIGYTYSKVEKQIDQINDGNWYNAKYDKPHDFSAVLSYEVSDRLLISSSFVYSSGSAVTFPTGRYTFLGSIVPIYSERNGERLPSYHRLDFSANLKAKKKLFGKISHEWVFSVYNAYNRKNAYSINFKQDENNPNVSYAEKASVFSIVPSITWNANF